MPHAETLALIDIYQIIQNLSRQANGVNSFETRNGSIFRD
jgi:hypothetical protein